MSSDDEVSLLSRPRRKSKVDYKVESSSEGSGTDKDDDFETDKTKGTKRSKPDISDVREFKKDSKQKLKNSSIIKKKHAINKADDSGFNDSEPEKSMGKCKQDKKKKPDSHTSESDFSNSDEEHRFHQLLAKYSPKKSKTKSDDNNDISLTVDESESVQNTEDTKNANGSNANKSSKIKFSRSVPLLVPNTKKIGKSVFLVQCDEATLDLEGDSGVIGTLKSTDTTMHFDVKGQLYDGLVRPSSTLMVIDLGPTEARVEAVMHDFVQLERVANPLDHDVGQEESGVESDGGWEEEEEPAKAKKKTDKAPDAGPKSKAKPRPKPAGRQASKSSAKKPASSGKRSKPAKAK